jgi:hypothetical protein
MGALMERKWYNDTSGLCWINETSLVQTNGMEIGNYEKGQLCGKSLFGNGTSI